MKKTIAALGAVLVAAALLIGLPGAGADDVARATSRVSVSGDPVVGGSLSAVPATWDETADTRTYEWLRDGEGDVLSHDVRYAPSTADAGHTLVVVERVQFGSTRDETSSVPVAVGPPAAAPVPPAPAPAAQTVNTRRPTVKGTAKVGRTLKVRSKGAWTPSPSSYSYQWLRNGKKIPKATRTSYRLTKKDRGRKITLRVYARRDGVATVTATSKASRKVK